MTVSYKKMRFDWYFKLHYQKVSSSLMRNKLLSIDAELEKGCFKGPEMKELNDRKKFLHRSFTGIPWIRNLLQCAPASLLISTTNILKGHFITANHGWDLELALHSSMSPTTLMLLKKKCQSMTWKEEQFKLPHYCIDSFILDAKFHYIKNLIHSIHQEYH